ncbi:MAG TPA: hypothetical protein H9844_04215 [Candidatus Evtepia faecigallinarum]|nr:hypothetical protein [Candidatus Evtepia faecigallinarum]
MLVIWVMFFIPTSPCYMGNLALVLYLIWMAVGLVLFLVSAGERRAVSKEQRAASMFSTMAD